MWNDIVKANCARANATASQPSNIGTIRYCPGVKPSTPDMTMVSRSADGSAIGVEQFCDGAVHLFVLALAVVLVDDLAALIDDVLRRPILIAIGVPGPRVVVLRDRIGDAVPLQRGLHIGCGSLEREF